MSWQPQSSGLAFIPAVLPALSDRLVELRIVRIMACPEAALHSLFIVCLAFEAIVAIFFVLAAGLYDANEVGKALFAYVSHCHLTGGVAVVRDSFTVRLAVVVAHISRLATATVIFAARGLDSKPVYIIDSRDLVARSIVGIADAAVAVNVLIKGDAAFGVAALDIGDSTATVVARVGLIAEPVAAGNDFVSMLVSELANDQIEIPIVSVFSCDS